MADMPDTPAAPAADDGFGDISAPESHPAHEGTTAPADDPSEPGDSQDSQENEPSQDETISNQEAAARRIAAKEVTAPAADPTEGTPAPAEAAPAETLPGPTPDQFLSQLEAELATELSQIDDAVEQRTAAIEARQYISEAKQATNQLVFDNDRVSAEIAVFNPASPEFNEDAYGFFLSQYEAAHTTTDQNGVIWPKQSLYSFMKNAASVVESVASSSAKKGQADEAKLRSRADVPGSRAPKRESDDDEFLKGFLGK